MGAAEFRYRVSRGETAGRVWNLIQQDRAREGVGGRCANAGVGPAAPGAVEVFAGPVPIPKEEVRGQHRWADDTVRDRQPVIGLESGRVADRRAHVAVSRLQAGTCRVALTAVRTLSR